MNWNNFILVLAKAIFHTKFTLKPYRAYLTLTVILAMAIPLSIEHVHASTCTDNANEAFDDDLDDLNDWFDGAVKYLSKGSPAYNAISDDYDDLEDDLDEWLGVCAAVAAAQAELRDAFVEAERQVENVTLSPGADPSSSPPEERDYSRFCPLDSELPHCQDDDDDDD